MLPPCLTVDLAGCAHQSHGCALGVGLPLCHADRVAVFILKGSGALIVAEGLPVLASLDRDPAARAELLQIPAMTLKLRRSQDDQLENGRTATASYAKLCRSRSCRLPCKAIKVMKVPSRDGNTCTPLCRSMGSAPSTGRRVVSVTQYLKS